MKNGLLKKQDFLLLMLLFIIMINIILSIEFFAYDPHHNFKANYFYGHISAAKHTWNQSILSGMPQYDKVFWLSYPAVFNFWQRIEIFLILSLLAATGLYILLRMSSFIAFESFIAALIYGLSLRFLSFYPIWHYGWDIFLVILPWLGCSLVRLRYQKGFLQLIFFSLLLTALFLTFEIEMIVYLLLALLTYLVYILISAISEKGLTHTLCVFYIKVSGGFLLAAAIAGFYYLPVLKARNVNFLDALQAISQWRLIAIIILVSLVFILLHNQKRRFALVLCVLLLFFSAYYVFIYKVPWLKDEFREEIYLQHESEIAEFIKRDSSNFRIFPLGSLFKDNRWCLAACSIGGSDNYAVHNYRSVLQNCLQAEIDKDLYINWNILKMLNVKYIISKKKIPSHHLQYAYYSPSEKLILYKLNPAPACAWFTKNVKKIAKQNILKEINNPLFNPFDTALIYEDVSEIDIPDTIVSVDENSVVLKNYTPERIALEIKAENPGFLVVSEVFDESGQWQAFLDENHVNIHQVDFILRGIAVPQGIHTLEFRWHPDNVDVLNRLRFAAWIVLLILMLSDFFSIFINNITRSGYTSYGK